MLILLYSSLSAGQSTPQNFQTIFYCHGSSTSNHPQTLHSGYIIPLPSASHYRMSILCASSSSQTHRILSIFSRKGSWQLTKHFCTRFNTGLNNYHVLVLMFLYEMSSQLICIIMVSNCSSFYSLVHLTEYLHFL